MRDRFAALQASRQIASPDLTAVPAQVSGRVRPASLPRRDAVRPADHTAAMPLPVRLLQPERAAADLSLPRAAAVPASIPPGPAIDPTGQPPSAASADLVSSAPNSQNGYATATLAYEALRRGDRRRAARLLEAALSAAPDAANAATWRGDLRLLRRRWRGDGYTLIRDDGVDPIVPTPLLGGSQTGGRLTYALDPLARQTVALSLRGAVAHGSGDSQLAAGVEWRPTPAVALAAERVTGSREAWTLRAAAGLVRSVRGVEFDGYGEAGVIGARRRDLYAAGQLLARRRLRLEPLELRVGAGAWGSVQRSGGEAARFDIGPTLGTTLGVVSVSAEWRFRIAGNAAPGSGPVLTASAAF